MADTAAGMPFTVLGPTDSIDEGRLTDLYSYPADLQKCWVRGNMIASIDGCASAAGKSGGLAATGDRAIFSTLRYAADVILVGAETVRVENYSGAQVPVTARDARQRRGQAEVPPIAVLTRSGNLDPDTLFFTRTEVPPLILTSADAFDDTRKRLGNRAEVLNASGARSDEADAATALQILARRGLFRVLSEGGPLVLSLLIAAGLLDELCVTIAPVVLAGPSGRIASGPVEVPTSMRPAHLLTDAQGYLYTRYVRSR